MAQLRGIPSLLLHLPAPEPWACQLTCHASVSSSASGDNSSPIYLTELLGGLQDSVSTTLGIMSGRCKAVEGC